MNILLMLHFLGIALAMGAGLSNILAKRQMPKADPATYPGMGLIFEALGKMASTGLLLLWITGVWMTALKFGGSTIPTLLWVKIVIVSLLTLVAISLNVMLFRAKRSGTAPDPKMANLHAYTINGLAIIAVIVAVILFK